MRRPHRLTWLVVITVCAPCAACTAGRSHSYGTPLRSPPCDGDPYLEVANFTNQPVQIYANSADGSKVQAFVGTAHEGTTRLRLEGSAGGKGAYFVAQVNHEPVPGVSITRRCDSPKS